MKIVQQGWLNIIFHETYFIEQGINRNIDIIDPRQNIAGQTLDRQTPYTTNTSYIQLIKETQLTIDITNANYVLFYEYKSRERQAWQL